MDTLSSSVSTLKAPNFHASPRERPHYTPQLLQNPNRSSSTSRRNSLSSRRNSFASRKSFSAPFSQIPPVKPPPSVHKEPATGFAAALLDIAQCNGCLEAVEKDVRRLSKLLRNNQLRALLTAPFLGVKKKGEILKELAEKGRFERHLVAMVKMLIEKNKMEMVGEMLGEFERIFDELSGTQVVLVSSATKMEEDQLFGIAKRVQRLSGAMKVKVRNLVKDNLPSYAV